MSETVGAALKAAREQRRLTLAQVSESTKVRTHYLQALESDDISAMPSAAQARGFLRLYADFLGLDLESLIRPAAAATPEPSTEPAVPESAGAQEKPGLSGFLAGLRARIAAGSTDKSSADAAPAVQQADSELGGPSPEAVEPPEPSAGKKKQNR